jgi:1,3-beta-glucan synthase
MRSQFFVPFLANSPHLNAPNDIFLQVLVSQIWNAIIISVYCEHLVSIEHVQKLLYHQIDSGHDGKSSLRAPPFFISQSDKGFKGEFFPSGSETERCISFAQSLMTAVPEPLPVDTMPAFTVLTVRRFVVHMLKFTLTKL